MKPESEDWYKFLCVLLLLTLAVPIAAFGLSPNGFTYSISFLPYILLMSVHEMGHLVPAVVMPLAQWLTPEYFIIVAGGTVFQLAFPLILFVYPLAARRYALAFIFLVLLGYSIINVGQYMSTAQTPTGVSLVSGESMQKYPETHDWRYMFESMGLLGRAPEISGYVVDFGYAVTLVSIFSAIFETLLVAVGIRTGDFFVILLYGAVPAFLISIFYASGLRLAVVTILFLISAAYFVHFKLPKLRKEFDEVDEGDEDPKKVKTFEEVAGEEEKLARKGAE